MHGNRTLDQSLGAADAYGLPLISHVDRPKYRAFNRNFFIMQVKKSINHTQISVIRVPENEKYRAFRATSLKWKFIIQI